MTVETLGTVGGTHASAPYARPWINATGAPTERRDKVEMQERSACSLATASDVRAGAGETVHRHGREETNSLWTA